MIKEDLTTTLYKGNILKIKELLKEGAPLSDLKYFIENRNKLPLHQDVDYDFKQMKEIYIDNKEKRIKELSDAILYTKSLIKEKNTFYDSFMKKILKWEKEIDILNEDLKGGNI